MNGFRSFLENIESGSYTWDGSEWSKSILGDKGISAYIDEKRVSVDNASPYHPQIKKALYALIKQNPAFKDLAVDFDGFRPSTVGEFLKNKEFEKRSNSKRLLPFLYHGTSSESWGAIERNGLMPRSLSGASPAYGEKYNAPTGRVDRIYLSGSFGAAVRFAAGDAVRNHPGSFPVVLRIDTKGVDPDLLYPDEDSKESTWQKSLHVLGSVSYAGTISPEYLELYAVKPQSTWEIYKPDPLAHHVRRKTQGWINI